MPQITRRKPGLYVFTCHFCGGADQRRKIGGLTALSLWQPVVKLFSPDIKPETIKIGRENTGY
jgi:hypothetical protein